MKKFNYMLICIVTIMCTLIFGTMIFLILKGFLKFDSQIKLSDFIIFLSVVIAFTAFFISSNQNNESLDIVKRQQAAIYREREAKQASKVSCWIEGMDISENWKGHTHYSIPYKATIQNNSAAPVYRAYIFSVSNKSNDEFDKINVQPEETVFIDVLPPGKKQ